MGWPQLLLMVIVCCYIPSSCGYDNSSLRYDDKDGRWETAESCAAGRWSSCLEGGAVASFSALIGKQLRLSREARIVQRGDGDHDEARSTGSLLASLAAQGDNFLRTAGLEIDLTDQLTEGGRYQPRFIDEIYTELDTLELKHAKPSKGHDMKKLFIPLLVILKLFKLKLLFLLPIILGVASFKKVIGVIFFLLPAIIAYFKVCKPDFGHSYGSYGHSSFYNAPPSLSEHQYTEDGVAYDRMSYRHFPGSHNLAYKGYHQ